MTRGSLDLLFLFFLFFFEREIGESSRSTEWKIDRVTAKNLKKQELSSLFSIYFIHTFFDPASIRTSLTRDILRVLFTFISLLMNVKFFIYLNYKFFLLYEIIYSTFKRQRKGKVL